MSDAPCHDDARDCAVPALPSPRVRADGGNGRNTRKDGRQPSGATINRDLVALLSFLRWCRDEKKIDHNAPKILREREIETKERWLSPDEIRAVEDECEPGWWLLFAVLLHTGIRVGEANGRLGRSAR